MSGVLVCTLLALGATLLWIPRTWVNTGTPQTMRYSWVWETEMPTMLYLSSQRTVMEAKFRRLHAQLPAPAIPAPALRVTWSLVFAEQALILLIGGGLLTVAVRRERRRLVDTMHGNQGGE